jgi:streptogramin lyase
MSDIRKYTVYSNSSEIIFNNTNYVFSLAANSSFIYGIKYDTEFSGENSVFRGSISSKQIENFVSPISPRHLAVDNNYIYFGDLYYKVIFRQSITGSSDPVFLSEDNHPRQITVDNSFVYWANGSSPTGIYKVSKNGGIKEKLTDAINAWGIYLYNDYLYWTDSDGGTINRISKNGGTNEVLAENQSSPRNITVDSHAVYWSNSGNNTVMKLVF